MGLLELPTELFEHIIHDAIQIRGLKRGMRLRLVNKTFARTVSQVIYSSCLLDEVETLSADSMALIPPTMLRSYLEYQVIRRDPRSRNIMLNCIRQVAEEIHKEQDICDSASFKTCVHRICSMALRFDVASNKHVLTKFVHYVQNWPADHVSYNESLLCAAICTNTMSIVKRCKHLIPELRGPDSKADNTPLKPSKLEYSTVDVTKHSSPYLEVAVLYGNPELLEYFMTHGSSTLDGRMRATLFAIATHEGQMEVVQFLYNFKKEEMPWKFTLQTPYGQIVNQILERDRSGMNSRETVEFLREFDRQHIDARALEYACYTLNLDVLKFVEDLRRQYQSSYHISFLEWNGLWRSIPAGLYDMSLHHSLTFPFSSWWNADKIITNKMIENACRNCTSSTALIELAVKYGADPNIMVANAAKYGRTELVRNLLSRGFKPVGALCEAVRGPYLDIVQLLLEAGADVNEKTELGHPLPIAIGAEHATIFDLLVDHGANIHHSSIARACVIEAKANGLTSILGLLENHGVDTKSNGEEL
ncbi:ankyrin repeat-containing domain protein [Phaeosphaeriaceae sp. PMI808]|nr:ankyrin repeat-containing domain protein [Phaeosphaeriaceae sp. PMI808]